MSKKITPIDSTRLYLRTSDRQFARLLWVRKDKLNDMFLGFYGVDGKPATITHEFPEHLINEKGPFSIKYKDAIPVAIELDHLSFHPDGRFSLKRRGEGNDRHSHIEHHADPD